MSLSQILGSYGTDSGSENEFSDENEQKCSDDRKSSVNNVESCSFFAEASSGSDEEAEKVENKAKPSILPKPFYNVGSSSVFENPFLNAEKAQSEILERHVKMSIKNPSFLDNSRKVKKSKQLCLMYKKGRCKYTSEQCRFSHIVGENLMQRLTGEGEKADFVEEIQESTAVYEANCVKYNEQEIEIKPRKKRAGVGDKLEPPKKAMQLFDKQRNAEAPWLYKK